MRFQSERNQLSWAYNILGTLPLCANSGLGNHLTMALAPDYTTFLVIRYGLHWLEVTPENLVLVNQDGTILEGEGPIQWAAVALHGPIHAQRRERAVVILHTHQPWFTALGCVDPHGLETRSHESAEYAQMQAYDGEYTGNWPQGALKEGEKLMQVIGEDAKVVLLANHGVCTITPTVQEGVFHLLNVERLAQLQLQGQRRTIGESALPAAFETIVAPLRNPVNPSVLHAQCFREQCARVDWIWTQLTPVVDRVVDARAKLAATCRMISHLNGSPYHEGYDRDFVWGNLVVPPHVRFSEMKWSDITTVSSTDNDACLLRINGRFATKVTTLAPLTQGSFLFFEPNVDCFAIDGGQVYIRGQDVAHVLAILQSLEAAAETQYYAEKSGGKLKTIDIDTLRAFPKHSFRDLTKPNLRMEQYFDAALRMLLRGFNQGALVDASECLPTSEV